LCASVLGCQIDERRLTWGADAAVGDVADVKDTGMEDTSEEPLGSDAYVFPGEPPEGTHCNTDGWCWIHPAPFPHKISELSRQGDQVIGVAIADAFRGYRPFVWDDSGVELLDVWFKSGTSLGDMTVAGDGWLTVERGGEVAYYATDGSKEVLRTLPGRNYRYISGNSRSDYLVVRDFEGGALVQGGDVTVADDYPGVERTLKMWPNGEVWGVEEPTDSDLEPPSNWNILEEPSTDDGGYIVGLGPGPTSSCADEGWWAYELMGSVVHWSQDTGSGEAVDTGYGPATHFNCDRDGRLAALTQDGGILRRTEDGWQRQDAAHHALYSMATGDDKTWIGGNHGTMLKIDDQAVDSLSRGFRPPSSHIDRELSAEDYGNQGPPVFTDLWVNDAETKVHLVYQKGAALGTEGSGWENQSVQDRPDGGWAFTDQTTVVGDRTPSFALGYPGVLRWVDGDWEFINFGDLQETADNATSIAGSPDDLWVLTSDDNLLHFDGGEWINTTDSSSDAAAFISENDTLLRRLHLTNDGELFIMSLNSPVYRAVGPPDDLDLELAFDPPCGSVHSMHRAQDGSIYVGGNASLGVSPCVAQYKDGGWTEFENPPEEVRPTGDRESIVKLIEQPGDLPLLAIGQSGIFSVGDDGQLRTEFIGTSVDAEYLSEHDALWVLTEYGILAKYYDE
jgi:hypothetical protein